MTIKTYPLQFTAEKLEQIAEIAKSQGKSAKQFMLEAIEKEIEAGIDDADI